MNLGQTLAAATLLATAAASPVLAREYNLGPYQAGAAAAQYNYQRYGETGYAQGGDVRNTCVKWCRRDSNPCDPPYFKQADGRCNPFD
jgi:hypothetical protein